jgi:cytochrome c-type biogenesis protein
MNEPSNLSFAVAFFAGILSFLSPCVLPLVPSYVGFLTGLTLPEMTNRRRVAFIHALLFILGFSLIFVLLGATATALGRALNLYQVWLQRVGGALIIVFGLICLDVIRLGLLQQERRVQLQDKPVGYLGSVLVGMAFAAGWTPCIGPVLGAIFTLAASQNDLRRGMLLLAAYSAGLAVPFLIAAYAIEAFLDWFQRFRKFLPWVMRLSGGLLVLVGVLMVTGQFGRLAGWLQKFTTEFLRRLL